MAKLGSVVFQIESMLKESGFIGIGESKKDAKTEAYENGAKNSHDVGSATKIYSGDTIKTYLTEWNQLGKWCKENEGLKDIKNISSPMIANYLEHKISQNVKFETFNKICTALNKMDDMMSAATGQKYDFYKDIESSRGLGKEVLDSSVQPRAFDDPKGVINSMQDPDHKIVANLQLETGLRIGDAGNVKISALEDGKISIENSKNGQSIEVHPSQGLYNQISENGGVQTKYENYITDMKQACEATGEKYSGSHSFRHNYAQNEYSQARESGESHKEALHSTAEKMGHHRGEITSRYLK